MPAQNRSTASIAELMQQPLFDQAEAVITQAGAGDALDLLEVTVCQALGDAVMTRVKRLLKDLAQERRKTQDEGISGGWLEAVADDQELGLWTELGPTSQVMHGRYLLLGVEPIGGRTRAYAGLEMRAELSQAPGSLEFSAEVPEIWLNAAIRGRSLGSVMATALAEPAVRMVERAVAVAERRLKVQGTVVAEAVSPGGERMIQVFARSLDQALKTRLKGKAVLTRTEQQIGT